MKLTYQGKKTEAKILEIAHSVQLELACDRKQSYLFHGDNFLYLSSLLKTHKESIDLIYIDPPYNTNRVFTVSEGRSSTISNENNGEVAYSDDREIDEYIEFLRERLVLMKELLSETGSIYVHIDDKIGHYVKVIMDEVFGIENFKNDISRIKSNPKNFGRSAYGNQKDRILFYAKNRNKNIFNDIKEPLTEGEIIGRFTKVDEDGRQYTTVPIHAPGETKDGVTGQKWKDMYPPKGRHWRYAPEKLTELDEQGLIEWSSTGNPRLKIFADEHKGKKVQDIWEYKDPAYPSYPTEKNYELLEFIIKQSSCEQSIVLDCFAGSGTTLKAAAQLGRTFLGIDESDKAIEVAKKSLKDVDYVLIDHNNDLKLEFTPIKQLSLDLSSSG